MVCLHGFTDTWAKGDDSDRQVLAQVRMMQDLVKTAAPHAEAIAATVDGRRQATIYTTSSFEHIPAGADRPPDLWGRLLARVRGQ